MQRLIYLTLLILFAYTSVWGQEQQEKISVNRGFINATVLDDERFVHGLKSDDFTLTINGNHVSVKSLDLIKALGLKPELESTASSIPGRTAGPRNAIVEPVHYLLFIDVFNSSDAGNRENREFALRFLDSLDDRNFVSIFMFDGALTQLTPATAPNPDEARPLLDSVIWHSRNPHQTPSNEEVIHLKNWSWHSLFMEKKENFDRLIKAVRSVAQGTRGQPYLKVMLYIGEGASEVAPEPGDSRKRGTGQPASHFRASQSAMQLSRIGKKYDLERELNNLAVRIYSIRRGAVEPAFIGGPEFTAVGATQIVRELHQWRLESLRSLSDITGGTFFDAGVDDETVIRHIGRETTFFYRIFFKVQPDMESSEYNHLELTVESGDYTVIHHKGFYGLSVRK